MVLELIVQEKLIDCDNYDELENKFTFDFSNDVDSHKYVFGFSIDRNDVKTILEKKHIFVESSNSIQLCFYYKDHNNKVLSKELVKSNEIIEILFPAECVDIDIFFRVDNSGQGELHSIALGDFTDLEKKISKGSNFKGNRTAVFKGKNISKKYVFVIETVFCDTETRTDILDKFFSFLITQVHMMKKVDEQNVFWAIHFSRDKIEYADKLTSLSKSLSLKNIIINIYEHPVDGYKNTGEEHIDRIVKPNITIPHLRESLFNSVEKVINKKLTGAESVFVRGVLDDDDFLNPNVFYGLYSFIESNRYLMEFEKFILINKRIFVSYFGNVRNQVDVDAVSFSRVVNGCKFSVARNNWGIHPFSISENILPSPSDLKYNMPVIDCSGFPNIGFSYSYNRIYGNLSSNSKKYFYEDVNFQLEFSDQTEFLRFFSNS